MNAYSRQSDMEALSGSVKTWGNWGVDDERGALNYVSDDKTANVRRRVPRGGAGSSSS